jgi:6-phosphogluconolactonase
MPEAPFYLCSCKKKAEGGGIWAGSIDTETGALGPVTLAAPLESAGYLAFSPDGRFLHATTGDGVAAFAVGPGGGLTPLNERHSGGENACHVCTDGTGQYVLVANYSSGNIACFRTGPDGSLGERTALAQYEGSGPHPERQREPYAHSVYTDPANRFVYSCDLGTDNVWVFEFDAARGALVPATPPSARVPPGSGPRHLAFHPRREFAYVCNELALTVTAFARHPGTGALTPLETVSAGREKGATLAGIFCHPNGKWLYVSNRGPDTIAVFAIGPGGGLTRIQDAPAHVKMPRGFGIDPSGRWLIAAGQSDDTIAVLKIDRETGRLSPAGRTAKVGSPICVLFAPGGRFPCEP